MRISLALITATAVSALPAYVSHKYKRALGDTDFQIVNLARNLESLELAYWNQGLTNYTQQNFTAAGAGSFYPYLKVFRDNEIAHFTLLNTLAGGNFTNCTYTFPVNNISQYLMMGQVITSVGEGAFIGALGNLTDPAVRVGGGSIIGNEARQNSKLREALNETYFNAVNFDTPLTADQAYSLAKPFFSCPASNAPIAFKSIPPIMATLPAGAMVGAIPANGTVSLKWDPSVYLGNNVFIRLLSGMKDIATPLTQTGNGTGTMMAPAGINGTAFIVATDYTAPGVIPAAYNYAVGYVVFT